MARASTGTTSSVAPATPSRPEQFGVHSFERTALHRTSPSSLTDDAPQLSQNFDLRLRPHAFHASFSAAPKAQHRPPHRQPYTHQTGYSASSTLLCHSARSSCRTGFGTAPARPALFGATISDRAAAYRTRKPFGDGYSTTPFLKPSFDRAP